jgi:hypothetical protein
MDYGGGGGGGEIFLLENQIWVIYADNENI